LQFWQSCFYPSQCGQKNLILFRFLIQTGTMTLSIHFFNKEKDSTTAVFSPALNRQLMTRFVYRIPPW